MRLETVNLTKKFADKSAVNNFSLKMNEGVYGFLGPNGAGKTTLIRMFADVLNPTSGKIFLDGIDKDELGADYRSLLGYLPQNMGYYKNFTAQKFLEYIGALKGLAKEEAGEKIAELLEIVGLSDYRNKRLRVFSGGMRRRIGIAQSLLNSPKILILDEPTGGLDPKERINFRNLISAISQDMIIILSTHIVSDIEDIAKRVILLKKGEAIKNLTIKELLQEIDGKVWEVIIDSREMSKYQKRYSIVNIKREDNKIKLRLIATQRPQQDALKLEPSLEDVYMYYFN